MADALALITSQEQRIKELDCELKAMRGAANSYKMHLIELTKENESLQRDYMDLDMELRTANTKVKRLTEEKSKTFEKGAENLTRLEEAYLKLEGHREADINAVKNLKAENERLRAENAKYESRKPRRI